jgi:sugar O-acyltransferase (sialic acid O-acetyltransferase NeuD family)
VSSQPFEPEEVLIIGAGGHGRELRCWYERAAAHRSLPRLIGFLDARTELHGADVLGVPVLGDESWLQARRHVGVLLGLGLPRVRAAVVRRLAPLQLAFPSVIDPSAVVGRDVEIGQGVIVCANATVTTGVQLNDFSMVNFGATVGHDCRIGAWSSVSPGANLSGFTVLGEGVDLGAGAVTIPGKSIGEWSIIGAGAVVTTNIPDNVMAAGVPATVRKTFKPGWHLL